MVMIENIHRGEFLDRSKVIRQLNISAIDTIEKVYKRGLAEGIFRDGLDAIELHWQVSALCFFNVSNRATFSKIFRPQSRISEVPCRSPSKRSRDDATLCCPTHEASNRLKDTLLQLASALPVN